MAFWASKPPAQEMRDLRTAFIQQVKQHIDDPDFAPHCDGDGKVNISRILDSMNLDPAYFIHLIDRLPAVVNLKDPEQFNSFVTELLACATALYDALGGDPDDSLASRIRGSKDCLSHLIYCLLVALSETQRDLGTVFYSAYKYIVHLATKMVTGQAEDVADMTKPERWCDRYCSTAAFSAFCEVEEMQSGMSELAHYRPDSPVAEVLELPKVVAQRQLKQDAAVYESEHGYAYLLIPNAEAKVDAGDAALADLISSAKAKMYDSLESVVHNAKYPCFVVKVRLPSQYRDVVSIQDVQRYASLHMIKVTDQTPAAKVFPYDLSTADCSFPHVEYMLALDKSLRVTEQNTLLMQDCVEQDHLPHITTRKDFDAYMQEIDFYTRYIDCMLTAISKGLEAKAKTVVKPGDGSSDGKDEDGLDRIKVMRDTVLKQLHYSVELAFFGEANKGLLDPSLDNHPATICARIISGKSYKLRDDACVGDEIIHILKICGAYDTLTEESTWIASLFFTQTDSPAKEAFINELIRMREAGEFPVRVGIGPPASAAEASPAQPDALLPPPLPSAAPSGSSASPLVASGQADDSIRLPIRKG